MTLCSQQPVLPASAGSAQTTAARTTLPAHTRARRRCCPCATGVRLHAVILRPADLRDAPSGGPAISARPHTPTGVDDFDSESVNHDKPELAASNYILSTKTFGAVQVEGSS